MLEYPAIESRYELAALYEKTEAAVSLRKWKAQVEYRDDLRSFIRKAPAQERLARTYEEKARVRLRKWEAEAELAHLESGGAPSALSGYIALRPELSARLRQLF